MKKSMIYTVILTVNGNEFEVENLNYNMVQPVIDRFKVKVPDGVFDVKEDHEAALMFDDGEPCDIISASNVKFRIGKQKIIARNVNDINPETVVDIITSQAYNTAQQKIKGAGKYQLISLIAYMGDQYAQKVSGEKRIEKLKDEKKEKWEQFLRGEIKPSWRELSF